MKKLLVTILLVLLVGCSKGTYTEVVEINYSDFESKINEKESFVLFMWQEGCSHCESFKPTLNDTVKKHDVLVYSINLSELEDKEYSKIENKTFIKGTPTMVYVKEGVVQSNKLIGNKKQDEIVAFFEKYDVIK